jgi:hypothetical protein
MWASALFILLSTPWFFWEWIAGFSDANILYPKTLSIQENPTLQVSEEEQRWLTDFLSQTFTWLDQGRQVCVFASPDGKYVLKVFKFGRLKPSFLEQYGAHIPWLRDYSAQLRTQRLRRLNLLFSGYQLAYEENQRYTGMRYIHLQPSRQWDKPLILKDRLGFAHTLSPNDICFAIQKKGVKTHAVLTQLLEKGDLETVKQRIDQIFEMYHAEYAQGILDGDHNILQNTGFMDGQPMRLDIGQLHWATENDDTFQAILQKIAEKRIYQWLQAHYPVAAHQLQEKVIKSEG